jgi:stage V sporulation protein G
MHLTEVRINLCAPTGHSHVNGHHRGPRNGNHGNGNGHGNSPGTGHGCNGGNGTRLKAFCSLTFDDTFVVRDVKLIEGNDGLFLAMPSRKLSDHCPCCGEKNHLRARYCNQCGGRLDEARYLRYRNGNGDSRLKLHADVAHPINAACRQEIEREVFKAYRREVDRSQQPGYVPPSLDGEDFDFYDDRPVRPAATVPVAVPQVVPQPELRAVGIA